MKRCLQDKEKPVFDDGFQITESDLVLMRQNNVLSAFIQGMHNSMKWCEDVGDMQCFETLVPVIKISNFALICKPTSPGNTS